MYEYLDLLRKVVAHGNSRGDRTGTGTISIFGPQIVVHVGGPLEAFPILTTKKVHFKSVLHELIWFISGATNVQYLQDNGVKIWDEWADEHGNLGPVYGAQWRGSWGEIVTDQLAEVIDQIKTNPNSRRLIVNAWNVEYLAEMALPPCHMMFQFYVVDNVLHMKMYQRSADIFLGVPFNLTSYALLLRMVAQVTGLKAGELIMSFGDVHLYNNHKEQAAEQLCRTPTTLPSLTINPDITDIDDFKYEDFKLVEYKPQAAIKAPISI